MRTRHVIAIVMTIMLAMIVVLVMTLLAIEGRPGPSKEAVLVSQVSGKYPEASYWPGYTIVNIAKETCAQLNAGVAINDTFKKLSIQYPVGAEPDYEMIAYTMTTGVREFCPQHLDQTRGLPHG